MMRSGSVMASWDPWVDHIWPHTTLVSKWRVTDHVYCLVNSQYLQGKLLVGYVLKSAIFGLVRDMCSGVAFWSTGWDMANDLSVISVRVAYWISGQSPLEETSRGVCVMQGMCCSRDGLCALASSSAHSSLSGAITHKTITHTIHKPQDLTVLCPEGSVQGVQTTHLS